MIAGLVLLAAFGLLAGAGWLVVRTTGAWRATILECQAALGGELTPGNLLLPPRLWLRTDDGFSLVVGLTTSGEGGKPRDIRIAGGARSLIASTRISVDGGALPGDMAILPAGAVTARLPSDEQRRVTLGIPDLDARMRLEGNPSAILSRMGIDRRAAVAAAVGQGASLEHGVWTIERAEPVVRASELIGLSRLLLAAARALEPQGTIADERLYESVRRDPEATFRLRCLDCLAPRVGAWRARATEAGLADPEPLIRLRAAQMAGVAGRSMLTELASGRFDDAVRTEAIAILANDDGPDVRALFEALMPDGTAAVRAAALQGMRRLGHTPVELLQRYCRHPDANLRALALQALRPAGPVAESRAIDALADPVPAVVRVALDILAAQGTVSAIPALRNVRVGPLDSALRAAVERAEQAIARRMPRSEVGLLSLAGPDVPEAGRLALDDGRGQLSDDGPAEVLDLFADGPAPTDLFADEPPGEPSPAGDAARRPLSPDHESG